MTLARLFAAWNDDLAQRGLRSLREARLKHYEEVDQEQNRRRLRALLEQTTRSLAAGRADLVVEHARHVAVERFEAGYELAEVQVSINVVEEAVTQRILAAMSPEEATGALCMVNTLFHVIKDVLAQTYVELAMQDRGGGR